MKTLLSILGIIVVVVFGLYLVPRAAPATATGAHAVLAPAPDFSLQKAGGGTVVLSEYKGKKPVILDFWATWCPNCQRDIPHQEEWYKKYKDSIEVIGINLQEDPSVVQAFAARYGVTYPVALDPNAVAARAYDVRYTNYHVLISKDGDIVRTVPGDIREQDFLSLINS